MKVLFFVTVTTFLLFSCQYNNATSDTGCEMKTGDEKESATCLVGTWRLVETLMDPGNGSGTYQPVNYDKTITFTTSGTYQASTKLCAADNSTSGIYRIESSVLKFEECDQFGYRIKIENGQLILSNMACIEACHEKYERVSSSAND